MSQTFPSPCHCLFVGVAAATPRRRLAQYSASWFSSTRPLPSALAVVWSTPPSGPEDRRGSGIIDGDGETSQRQACCFESNNWRKVGSLGTLPRCIATIGRPFRYMAMQSTRAGLPLPDLVDLTLQLPRTVLGTTYDLGIHQGVGIAGNSIERHFRGRHGEGCRCQASTA